VVVVVNADLIGGFFVILGCRLLLEYVGGGGRPTVVTCDRRNNESGVVALLRRFSDRRGDVWASL
jgi:hypothetical protein